MIQGGSKVGGSLVREIIGDTKRAEGTCDVSTSEDFKRKRRMKKKKKMMMRRRRRMITTMKAMMVVS